MNRGAYAYPHQAALSYSVLFIFGAPHPARQPSRFQLPILVDFAADANIRRKTFCWVPLWSATLLPPHPTDTSIFSFGYFVWKPVVGALRAFVGGWVVSHTQKKGIRSAFWNFH